MNMIPFAALLGAMNAAAQAEASDPPEIQREAMAMRLKEALPRFQRACPFKVGDLITPYPDAPVRGAGDPHLVIDVEPEAEEVFAEFEGLPGLHSAKFDIRALFLSTDRATLHPIWSESAWYEPYPSAASRAAPTEAGDDAPRAA